MMKIDTSLLVHDLSQIRDRYWKNTPVCWIA